MNYKSRRFNKVIELWEDGQPAWYTTAQPTPGVDAYELGKAMCKTWADMINYDMEHELYRSQGTARFHARAGGWRRDAQRPSHAGGVRDLPCAGPE